MVFLEIIHLDWMHLIFSNKKKKKKMHLTISLTGKVNLTNKVMVK